MEAAHGNLVATVAQPFLILVCVVWSVAVVAAYGNDRLWRPVRNAAAAISIYCVLFVGMIAVLAR